MSQGLVCMIPCSAGAYCPPVRTTNNGTSCEPYETVAKPYLGCGGAETNFACPAGYYCPNTSTTILCPEDSYCPSGSRYHNELTISHLLAHSLIGL
jgi:hypothetical protein